MAEQSTYTATSLPVDGTTIDAADVNTDLQGLIDEFNKQVPESKISAETAWTTWTTTYSGFSSNPTQTLRYRKFGRHVTVAAGLTNLTGTSNATTFTMTLPFAAAVDLRIPIYALDNTSTSSTGRAETAVSSTTLTLSTTIGGTGWTASGAKGVSFCFTYESTS